MKTFLIVGILKDHPRFGTGKGKLEGGSANDAE